MQRRILDIHLHLNKKMASSAKEAARLLHEDLVAHNIEKALILHLNFQGWSAEEFSEALTPYKKRMAGLINIHPFEKDARAQLKRGIDKLGFIGLKLHPRLENYSLDAPETQALVRRAGELNVPTLIDAFPDGTWLMNGYDTLSFGKLALACPQSRIIVAHMGGHRVLDMLMLVKRIKNLYFDFSYSLLYFQKSSVLNDILFAMRSLKCERLFYGSDYPDRSIADTIKQSLEILEGAGFTDAELDRLLFKNAKEFFNWNDI